jgi:hypothetical protein
MTAAARAAGTLGRVVVAPNAAWRGLAVAPPVVWLCVWVSVLQMALVAAQSQLVWTALAAETNELVAEARHAIGATRILAIVATPLATGARALLLSTLLWLASPAPLGSRLALAFALEIVPLLESAALTGVGFAVRPADLDALRSLRLYAGLDLWWRPSAPWADAAIGAANVFSIWWALLVACGSRRVLGASWRAAAATAATAWVARVAWSSIWTS